MMRKKQQLTQEECIAILKSELRGVLSVLGDEGYPYGMPIDHYYCEKDGKWALNIKSVIVFGRIEFIEDQEITYRISEDLSRKFTDDEEYIRREIDRSGLGTLLFALVPEHITGKRAGGT